MLKSLVFVASGAGFALAMAIVANAAATEPPKAVDLLFEGKHIAQMPVGTELKYTFERKPSDEKLLGPGYSDSIKLKIDADTDSAPGKKDVTIEMYSGERAREPNHSSGLDGNPMLVVYLDTALGHFRQLAGGDYSYLKNRFSKSFESAKVLPVKVTYKGADVDGYRVTVQPFEQDPSKSKMRGFEVSEFTLTLSDKIPGQFAQMISMFNNSDKSAPSLVERTTLEGVSEVK